MIGASVMKELNQQQQVVRDWVRISLLILLLLYYYINITILISIPPEIIRKPTVF